MDQFHEDLTNAGGRKNVARQICDALRSQIMSGVYGPGTHLPSTRALAVELGVSRTTVTAAYEQLLAEGFLESRQGAKARVAAHLAMVRSVAKHRTRRSRPVRLSTYGRRIADLPAPASSPTHRTVVDFRYGDVSAADFPTLPWKRALNTALLRRPQRLRYGDPCGGSELHAALQGYLWRARSLRCDIEQIIVVNGSQQGLDLCARVLLDPGDRFVIEDPCYALARQAFIAVGSVPVAIEVRQDGLRTDRLREVIDARLCYVTPSHQFPLGGVMSAGSRQELLAWAGCTCAYIIEDDYDSEYRYDISPIRPLQTVGGDENVIYVGTVSKTLSPTLRLGYLIVPHALREVFATAKRLADRHTPSLEQEALADFLASGAYERHVRRARRRNAERRVALLEALSAKLGSRVTIVGADAGLHVVVWINCVPRRQEAELVTRGQSAGLGLYPVTPLYSSPDVAYRPDQAGLVIGYAGLDEGEIKRGVDRLAGLLKSFDGISMTCRSARQ
jgi:GntR family transcriptional regulator/MocR family aminotransferase